MGFGKLARVICVTSALTSSFMASARADLLSGVVTTLVAPSIPGVPSQLAPFIPPSPLSLGGPIAGLPAELVRAGDACKSIDQLRQTSSRLRSSFVSEAARAPIPNDGMTLFEVQTPGNISYNARLGMSGYKIVLPFGLELDKAKVKSNLDGHFSVPQFDLKKFLSNWGFIKMSTSNGYGDWASKQNDGAANYRYVSSKRFVDAISAGRAAQEIGWAVATAGATTEGSMDALKEHLVLEWADITSWLTHIGEDDAVAKSRQIAQQVFGVAGPDLKSFQFDPAKVIRLVDIGKLDVDVRFSSVDYDHSFQAPFAREFKKILDIIKVDGKFWPETRVKDPHLGFTIVIRRKRSALTEKKANELLQGVLASLRTGPDGSLSTAVAELSGDDQLGVRSVSPDAELAKKLQAVFAPLLSDKDHRYVGEGVFDFTNSSAARSLEDMLKNFSIGDGSKGASVRRLHINVLTGAVDLDFELTHKYRLTKDDVIRALSELMGASDGPFRVAQDACRTVQRVCANDVVKTTAFAICSLAGKNTVDLPALPAIQLNISDGMPQTLSPQHTSSGTAPTGVQLPLWCIVDYQSIAFEVSLDGYIRSLTGPIKGKTTRRKDGALQLSATKADDVLSVDLPWDEQVTGTIASNGRLRWKAKGEDWTYGKCRTLAH